MGRWLSLKLDAFPGASKQLGEALLAGDQNFRFPNRLCLQFDQSNAISARRSMETWFPVKGAQHGRHDRGGRPQGIMVSRDRVIE